MLSVLTRHGGVPFYTISLHDALPIWQEGWDAAEPGAARVAPSRARRRPPRLLRPGHDCSPRRRGGAADEGVLPALVRSEEHTSELQSLAYLVCRLLLEKKKFASHRPK